VTALIVLAKAPRPGRVKTRLCPPCSATEASDLAEAALRDTLEAAAASHCGQRVLVLDGPPGAWVPDGFEVLPQRGGTLDHRIAGAFADVAAAALLIGMDTPQLSAELLDAALDAGLDGRLGRGGCDAALGPTLDGGYWAVGLTRPNRRAFLGVPMSTPGTFAAQRRRFDELGLRTRELAVLRDVDVYADAIAVAAVAPHTRFAAAFRRLNHAVAT
jgi:rSAM/selenodomain-associated transferase 1